MVLYGICISFFLLGSVAYNLDLPPSSMIHPVFHISQLKPFVPKYTAESTELSVPIVLDAAEVFPEKVLDRRLIKNGNKAYLQVQIKWSSLPESSATREDHDVLKQSFPNSPAWRPAGSCGGGNVTPDGA